MRQVRLRAVRTNGSMGSGLAETIDGCVGCHPTANGQVLVARHFGSLAQPQNILKCFSPDPYLPDQDEGLRRIWTDLETALAPSEVCLH